jgi:hypothetical protein
VVLLAALCVPVETKARYVVADILKGRLATAEDDPSVTHLLATDCECWIGTVLLLLLLLLLGVMAVVLLLLLMVVPMVVMVVVVMAACTQSQTHLNSICIDSTSTQANCPPGG